MRGQLFFFCLLGVFCSQGPAVGANLMSDGHAAAISRNPFKPPVTLNAPPAPRPAVRQEEIEEEAHSLALRATLVDGEDSLADINGSILRRGESVKGFLVLRISEDEVVLEKNGQPITLPLAKKR